MQSSPLCQWGCAWPVWPWRSCLCRWFSGACSSRCGAARLLWTGACCCAPRAWSRSETAKEERERKQFRPLFVFSRPQFFTWERLWRLNLNAQMGGLQSNALIISLSELGWFWLDRTVASRHLILTLSRHAEGGRDEEWGRKKKRLWKSRD